MLFHRWILGPGLLVAIAALAAALVFLMRPAGAAAPILVTRFDDPPPDTCVVGDCSLREAIIGANNAPGADTIILPGGAPYNLTIPGFGENASATGDLDITDDVTIDAGVSGTTVIDAGDLDSVLDVWSGTASINGVVLRNGSGDYGGGVYVTLGATLNLTNSTVRDNYAFGFAAGIDNDGNMTLTNVTVTANTTPNQTGGMLNNFGTATITNSTISGNSAGFGPGGVYNFNGATLNINSSTISANTTNGGAGGIDNGSGTVNVKNTIVAGNVYPGGGSECFGPLNSQGNNLIETVTAACSITGDTSSNVIGQPANLGPLANNGGPTLTHALMAGSPAIDFASADCPPPATDQRGVVRPQGNRCDIGAYESSFSGPTPVPTPSQTPTPTPTTGPSPSPTPTPSASPTPTPSASPTTTPTPTPTPSPTPTGTPEGPLWGDVDCAGDVDSVDSLKLLRYVAGLPVTQNEPCTDIGEEFASLWGDLDCGGDVSSVDALKVLRYVASLSVAQTEPCPDIGTHG